MKTHPSHKILIWDKLLPHMRTGVPYEYTHMGRPICVWANIRIWGRTDTITIITGLINMPMVADFDLFRIATSGILYPCYG